MGRYPYNIVSPFNSKSVSGTYDNNSNPSPARSRQWIIPSFLPSGDNFSSVSDSNNNKQALSGLTSTNGTGTTNNFSTNCSSTATKGGSGGKQFVLSIPPVPDIIAKTIAVKVSKSAKPYALQETRIRVLTAKKNDQRERLTAWEDKLSELENQKEVALSDIITKRRKEKDDAVSTVEKRLREQFDEELNAKEITYKKELEDEINAKRKSLSEKHEKQCEEEKEQAQKRLKLLQEAADVLASTNNEPEVSSGSTSKAKRQQQEQQQQQQNLALAFLLDESNNEQVQAAKKRIEEKRNELQEIEKQNEKLNEVRSEMIWLLKEVIKAEEKHKVKLDTTTATATTTTTINKQSSSTSETTASTTTNTVPPTSGQPNPQQSLTLLRANSQSNRQA